MQNNTLSLKINLQDNTTIKINDTKLAKVHELPYLVPFFTELMQCHTDYSTGIVRSLPTIYGSVKTKKCIKRLEELRIIRYSRAVCNYVLMDGVIEKVTEE